MATPRWTLFLKYLPVPKLPFPLTIGGKTIGTWIECTQIVTVPFCPCRALEHLFIHRDIQVRTGILNFDPVSIRSGLTVKGLAFVLERKSKLGHGIHIIDPITVSFKDDGKWEPYADILELPQIGTEA